MSTTQSQKLINLFVILSFTLSEVFLSYFVGFFLFVCLKWDAIFILVKNFK